MGPCPTTVCFFFFFFFFFRKTHSVTLSLKLAEFGLLTPFNMAEWVKKINPPEGGPPVAGSIFPLTNKTFWYPSLTPTPICTGQTD